METRTKSARKVTVSLPNELVAYADGRADRTGISRSQVIGQALAFLKATEEGKLAAEGYSFYSAEAEEFAAASNWAVAEAWADEAGLESQS